MSKKKLLEFGLKEADAFQKNFKIIFDRLVRGYKSVMGKDPEGIDLLKVKMEAREKALNTTKVVNQKGLTLDPDKPIVGGTQEGIETITTKSAFDELENFTKRPEDIVEDMVDEKFGKNFFGDELDNVNLSKDDPMGDLEKIIKGEGDTGLPKPTTEVFEEALGVRLYGDETFEELMKIKETGVHPRGEPPIKKADGGRVGFALGGPTNIIGSDLINLGIPGAVQEDEFEDIQGQTAGLGVLTGLSKVFGPTLGPLIFNRGRKKVLVDPAVEATKKRAADIKKAREAEQLREVASRAAANRAAGRGGYQSSFGRDRDFMGGAGRGTGMGAADRGGSDSMGSFANGGLVTLFTEKR